MEWRLHPLDVLFFRGPEPMNAGEAATVRGLFPPSPNVLQGVVRTRILEAAGISYDEYRRAVNGGGNDAATAIVTIIGHPGLNLGQLQIRGPYLVVEGSEAEERWYPAPLDLTRNEDGTWLPASPGPENVESDLGTMRFVPQAGKGSRYWIEHEGLERYLRRDSILDRQVEPEETFCTYEPRIGLQRDRTTRTAADTMLYAPSFVRLHDRRNTTQRVSIGLRVIGIDADLHDKCKGITRLGGEGRLAELTVHPEPVLPAIGIHDELLRLVLLTPARLNGTWHLPGLQQNGGTWRGSVDGVEVEVVSAVVGRSVRIGGWDIVNAAPKPAVACVPAGSVYFLHALAGDAGSLHDHTVGGGAQAGFGHLLAGAWAEGATA